MHFSAANLLFLRWVIFFINLFCFSFSDGQMSEVSFMSEVSLICGTNRAPSNTSYITPFVSEMEVLSQLVTTHEWGQHSSNTTPPIHVLAQCYQDLSHTDCLLCYANSRTRIPRCLPAMSARMYLDGCFLRYDNYSFFNESTDPIRDTVNCSTPLGQIGGNGAARSEFQTNVGHLIDNLTASAVADGGYAVEEMNGIYGLAQCWRTLNRDECRTCLEKARTESRRCFPSREGRALNAGCYLRYSTENFYSRNSNKKSGISTGAIVAIALAAAALFTITLFVGFAVYLKYSKSKKERKSLGQISISLNRSGLNFKYETLEKATNFFDQSRKIGQGGAGSVFRGTLPDGKTVAVKRLYFSTKQWVDEFFNEVNLISGIQHKNLVKLLGCSIEGPESLLVYEYVPNRSLDQFLFDKNKIHTLNWKQRLNIIIGTAEGLAYLHGGTEIRIIHRDIKSSNVLLDENFAPKIADFGLARHFGADKSHLSTGIAGTLGYMAPEYIVRGQLTEKADVFSFGVLVLEILCGRKNNVFVEDSGSLLQTVWKLYITGRQTETMDSSLNNDFPIKEASMVLQLGLLCTQASAALRPSMDEVVRMLQTDEDQEIPSPTQPPFLNPRALDPNSSSRSYTTNSLILNALSKIEVSYTTTESSSI